MKLLIECEMPEAWLNSFLSMLNDMETLGRIEASAIVGMFVDGSNGFSPSFKVKDKQTKVNEFGSITRQDVSVSIKRYKDKLPYGIHIKTNSDAGQKYYHTAIIHRPSWENHEWDEPHWKKLKVAEDGTILPEVEYDDVEGYEEDEVEEGQENLEAGGDPSQVSDTETYWSRDDNPNVQRETGQRGRQNRDILARAEDRSGHVEREGLGSAETDDEGRGSGVGSFKKRKEGRSPEAHREISSGPIISIQRGGVHN